MIQKISDILKSKGRTYSIEFFAPKTDKGYARMMETAAAFAEIAPDWFSVTYGAGGTTQDSTLELVDKLQKRLFIPTMHHLTCVGHSPAELETMLQQLEARDIRNILALLGDPPQNVLDWKPAADQFQYCYQLVKLIRSHKGFFSVGVAGFPEGHINCPDKETDARYLKHKIDAGGEFVITQLFFDNRDYFEYVARVRRHGVKVRIIPGILPITDYQALIRFCNTCGASIPQRVHEIFRPLDGDATATIGAGIEFTTQQCRKLLEGGAPGLHFFSLNKINPTLEIIKRVQS